MGEFELIQRYFSTPLPASSGVELGIGDDCAVLRPDPRGRSLAISVDTLTENTHFLPDTDPAQLAARLLGATVSDLAAMGAEPAWFTLALTLPHADPLWLDPFAKALHHYAQQYGVVLIGGDTTSGPLTLTVQVHGWVDSHLMLTRAGAQPDDLVYVSGYLGDSRGGLEVQLHPETELNATDKSYLLERFFQPTPRVALGQHLLGIANSAIDISDGFIADLRHILERSQCGAHIDLDALPISDALARSFSVQSHEWAASGGEDFELCFTVPVDKQKQVAELSKQLQLPLTCVGKICTQQKLTLLQQGQEVAPAHAGFDHFGDRSE